MFQEDPDGPMVCVILGRLVDGVCRAGKLMCRDMKKPHSLNFKRYSEYALHLQEFLHGQLLYVESITLQLLNLSMGDHGEEHVDVCNDHRSSYDCTMVKVMNFVDSNSHLYSLKIVCGFRKRLGDFYSVQMSKINTLLVNARKALAEVNASYSRLVSHHRGTHFPDILPTWSNIDSLHFDDMSPWESRHITPEINQECLQILTGASRGLWLLAALTSIFELAPQVGESGVIHLLLIMSWQNSFQHFWEVCKVMKDRGVDGSRVGAPSTIYEYFRVARELFYLPGKEKGQEMFGGEFPRYGPIGFDFKDVFGTDMSPNNEVVDRIGVGLCDFLDEVNALVGKEIHCALVMEIFLRTSERIRAIAKCELGCFRLMIFLQGAVYLGVRVQPGVHLRQIFFPIEGSGSWSHLKEAKIAESEVEAVCLEVGKELSTADRFIWMDEVEVILCESKDSRLLKKFDLIIKGQSLFKLDDDGRSFMKLFGQTTWVPVSICYHNRGQ